MIEEVKAPPYAPAGPIDNPDAIRELVDAIWAATHTPGLTDREICFRLSLLSGMAVAALLQYARSMEPTTQPGERV
jgi:hypothetical protein